MQAHCTHRLRLILPSLTLSAAKITLQGVCLQIAFFCQGAWHGVFRRAVSPHCIHYINVSPSGWRPHALAHTVVICTFTFHKISGFVRVILKANLKPPYRSKISIFWSQNSDLLYSFFFYFLQNFQIQCFLHTVANKDLWGLCANS